MAMSAAQLKSLRKSKSASRLREARSILGLTQEQLAEAVGVSQSSLSDLERQRYGGVTIDTAHRFAEFFGCSIEDLFPSREAVAS